MRTSKYGQAVNASSSQLLASIIASLGEVWVASIESFIVGNGCAGFLNRVLGSSRPEEGYGKEDDKEYASVKGRG